MMRCIHKYISLLLLALFLFPLLEKEAHAIRHTEVAHCKAADKHFHELKHTCFICAFIVPVTTVPAQHNYDFSIYVSSALILSDSEAKIISAPKYFVSLRAPPMAA